ncbi:MAG: zinc metalloprotease HtpX [Methylococcaceae bacterium]|nr:zinc metalloprotease HtpX [Methylococcaceae bacterium]
MNSIHRQHRWANWLQSVLLVLALLGISGLTGSLLLGEIGLWVATGGALIALLFEPVAAWRLTLYLYRARPIHPAEAPALWRILQILAERAELPAIPALYYVPSPVINAFAVGSRKRSAIALTGGLLKRLNQRELAGVIGHEIAHIAHDDLKVMGLADYVSRLTNLFSGAGQLMILFALPLLWVGGGLVQLNFLGIAILIFSPHFALIAQLGLARVREYDADLKSASLTGDPMGLAYALAKIEQASRSWLAVLLPGWGNPEPSWLRSHPPTEERIKRLRQYADSFAYQQRLSSVDMPSDYIIAEFKQAPRWRIGGLWR